MSKEVYQVEKIVGFKRIRRVPHYKVHWLGYKTNEDTWEPARNLKTCLSLIEEFHARKTPAKETARHNTHRQTARVPVEVSSDDEEHKTTALSPRRSHRARTPTRYFLSEVPTPRKRRSVTPKPTASTEREEESSTEEEEEEEDSEGGKETVERSEYDLQSYAMLRRSPRRKNSTHYFNLELPQPRKQGSGKGWVAEDDTATPDEVVMSQGNQPTREAKRTTVAHSLALSSDEEGRGEGGKSVTPRISLYETRMRERLGKLTSVTKKQVTDAFSSLTARKSDPPSSSSTSSSFQPQPDQPPTTRSQAKSKPPSKSSLATTLSSSVYETRSRMTWSQPLVLSPPATQMSLRSSKTITTTATATTTLSPPDQTKGVLSTDSPPPPLDPSSVTEPVELPPTPPQGYPQWMRFGCDEVVLLLVVFSLILFAYYCFHSDGC